MKQKYTWKSLMPRIKIRNKKIVAEVAKGDLSYGDIGKKHNLSPQRIKQIAKQFGVNSKLKKGLLKYDTWIKRISLGRKGKRKGYHHSEATKTKISETMRNKKVVIKNV